MRSVFLSLCLLCGLTAAYADTSVLDTAVIRKNYQDGDFDKTIPILESALKPNQPLSHADSAFTFKYLGVMYLADEKTREKGKYFLLQLLHVEPTERILDMYPSDSIYATFQTILAEFNASQGNPNPGATSPSQKMGASKKTYYWMGAATIATGIGVAVYFLSLDKPDKVQALQVD